MRQKDIIRCATHLPVLVKAFTLSKGNVAELGAGYFSTTILRWLCEMSGRNLYTYESKQRWYEKAIQDPKPFHKVIFVPDWESADIEKKWGLVFIDHAPGKRRWLDIKRLANFADYIVIHDTNPEFRKEYRYHRIWKYFKYRRDFTLYSPHTTVVSNFHKLDEDF